METLTLNAAPRTDVGTRKVSELRGKNQVPAVVYGKKQAPLMVSVDAKIFGKMLKVAGESTLIDLAVEGSKTPLKTLVQDVQRDPVSDSVIHVDFRAVSMDEKLHVKIPFNFVGESFAVKSMSGTLVKNMEEVEVMCLPGALVNHIDVDISSLKSFEDKVRLHDVKLPEGMELVAKTDEVVVLAAPPRSEEELAELDKAVDMDVSKVEVAKKEKKEEEGEEGAAPAAEEKKAPEKK